MPPPEPAMNGPIKPVQVKGTWFMPKFTVSRGAGQIRVEAPDNEIMILIFTDRPTMPGMKKGRPFNSASYDTSERGGRPLILRSGVKDEEEYEYMAFLVKEGVWIEPELPVSPVPTRGGGAGKQPIKAPDMVAPTPPTPLLPPHASGSP
jgi:hypothetical protein